MTSFVVAFGRFLIYSIFSQTDEGRLEYVIDGLTSFFAKTNQSNARLLAAEDMQSMLEQDLFHSFLLFVGFVTTFSCGLDLI
jgi:hypothetical protein